MAGIREIIKTAEGIRELSFILSVPIATVQAMADRFNHEGEQNMSEEILEDI